MQGHLVYIEGKLFIQESNGNLTPFSFGGMGGGTRKIIQQVGGGAPFFAEITGKRYNGNPQNKITLTANVTGGVGTLSYEWTSRTLFTLSNLGVPGPTPQIAELPPFISSTTNIQDITNAIDEDSWLGLVSCKITESTGGLNNPSTNIVIYTYFLAGIAISDNPPN